MSRQESTQRNAFPPARRPPALLGRDGGWPTGHPVLRPTRVSHTRPCRALSVSTSDARRAGRVGENTPTSESFKRVLALDLGSGWFRFSRPFESHRAPQVGEDKARRVLQPCGARLGGARFSRHTEVPSKNPLADRGAQGTPPHAQSAWGGVRRRGKCLWLLSAKGK